MKRHHLSKKEAKQLIKRLSDLFPELSLTPKSSYEIIEETGVKIYLVDREPVAAEVGGAIIPLLQFLIKRRNEFSLPRVVVDKGAVGPVSRGADVMAPGIVRIEGEFEKGGIAVIIDETHRMPLAVCRALHDSETIRGMKRGKVLENLHHVGDKLWKLCRSIT